MKIAIHQPNYLPWIGFFDKLDQVDQFVFLDNVSYSKGGFINRNKVKTPQGSIWLSVPVKSKKVKVNEVLINYSTNWQQNHWRIIESNYKRSKYWDHYASLFKEIYQEKFTKLAPLNIKLIKLIMELLTIDTKLHIASHIKGEVGTGNERNVNLVRYLNGNIYVSGEGARAYNDIRAFQDKNIQLVYQNFVHPKYPQRWGSFISHLSIIDMLFNCGPETIKMIRKHRQGNLEAKE